MKCSLPALVAAACLAVPQSYADHHPTSFVADEGRIKAHIGFLAHDLLEGRQTGSKGHEIASQYIATQFAQYGLEPAGDNGGYLQQVTFRRSELVQESPKLSLSVAGADVELTYPSQYLTWPSTVSEQSQVSGEMVFVGYGVYAPQINHDDYAGLDVEGKVVVMLSGKPKSFPTEEGAHFGSGREKARYAAERGAIGMISVTTPTAEKVRPYQSRLNYLHTPSFSWLQQDGSPANVQPSIKGSAFLSKEAAEILFKDAKMNLASIYALLEKDEVPEGFVMPGTISLSKTSVHSEINSPNVAAILPGSDETLKKEYVVYSAHSDHIGIAKSVKKDKINNGAMDNASGTAIMLETANLFSQMAEKPKRSILFVAVTGEEKGLLGSDYFARNPTVPSEAMVANINLDMPVLTYEFADVIAFGANHSEMGPIVKQATQKVDVSLTDDPWPEQNLFTRSDHYSFVKQGVPSVFLVPGTTSADPAVDGSKQFWDFLQTHYHKPSDELNAAFNWKAARKFAEVNLSIGTTIGNLDKRPLWNSDSFFGQTFGHSASLN